MTQLLFLIAATLTQVPVVQPGASTEFHRACLAVEEALAAGDVPAARAAAASLPRRVIKLEFDASTIPEARRKEFEEVRDRVMSVWQRGITGVSITAGAPADIRVRFVKSLPPAAGSPLPAGAAHLFSAAPDQPRLEAVIALERGNPARATEAADVHNELGYAIGAYFGLAADPLQFGAFMGRSDLPTFRLNAPSIVEYRKARANLELCETLRKLVLKGEKIQAAHPQIWIDAPVLPQEPAIQGEPIRFNVQITNRGDAPLSIELRPDCGCLSATPAAVLEAGDTRLMQAMIDTTEFVGPLHKRLIVYSNDPDFPVKEIPINVRVTPRYRLLAPGGPVVIASQDGAEFQVFLALDEKANFKPTGVRLNGMPGEVAQTPWSGKLADPELGEPATQRSGYRYDVKLEGTLAPGRSNGTLIIDTDSDRFPTLYYSFSAQKGIVALPDELYFGEIPKAPRRGSFLVSRPGQGFKVLKITSPSSNLFFEHTAVRDDWEYLVTVQFDGKVPFGNYTTTLIVETNDPKQPKLIVPVRAVVR
ncbi:MAG: DUF1573 domain-containing protein [Fimbriimonadaceae bacterium]|nr:DUF1573 domain-containing protein [Chthonomonadaceae bacterium]MCO5295720.1 DUF1573 domain-containing protein [Fimbriimonadaceae bacterium]